MNSLRVAMGPDGPAIANRIGVARLAAKMFVGEDMRPLWVQLMGQVTGDADGAGVAMDLSVLAQMLGDAETGLAIQRQALTAQRLFRSPCRVGAPRLRLLALAAVRGLGGNTPLEFLLEDSDIELVTLYLPTGVALPDPLPAHDVAFVAIPEDDETRDLLATLERPADIWPRPLINPPRRIRDLARDRLWRAIGDIDGVEIPQTVRVARDDLTNIMSGARALGEWLTDGGFPIIARPLGSHAGRGLDRIECAADIARYLASQPEEAFFISRFVDYSRPDGLYRKCRVVVVDGHAYPCHMGVSDQWAVWYLNADMARSIDKRAEEQAFMDSFEETFARRHGAALADVAAAIGLDYLTIDCAETTDGALLIFEADHTGIVHDMDPPDLYPYKSAHMHNIFRAFAAMVDGRAAGARGAQSHPAAA